MAMNRVMKHEGVICRSTRRKPMIRKLTVTALATLVFGMLTCPAMAQTPSVTITAGTSQVYPGDDVKFKASLSSAPGHAVLVRVKWAGYDRYWWLQPNFQFSFPCNLTNKGSHTITIETANDTTNEATCESSAGNTSCAGSTNYPTAYNVGSPGSATSTCN